MTSVVKALSQPEIRSVPVGTRWRRPIDTVKRAVWQHLRDQGGFHTPDEVSVALCLPRTRGHGPLSWLWNRGHVARKRVRVYAAEAGRVLVSGERWAYGVTLRCVAPRGESIDPAQVQS